MTYTYVLLHLSLIPDIGPATVQHLVTIIGNREDLSNLYEYSSAQLCAQFGLTQKRAQALVSGLADLSLLERELHLIEKHSIAWTTVYSDDYPPLLRAIHLPPTIIYWRGLHPINYTNPVAVVGSREANHYGQTVINSLVPSLVQAGCIIISGGAVGADTMAHRAAIEAGGQTCVVLGSGLLHLYPFENSKLFNAIADKGGTLLSAFPLNTPPTAKNFPARNRIISGLSQGCVVVQANQKSGARITAECALEQGRSVCAIPGPINDPLSAGCHELIKCGALLTTGAEDILQELGYESQNDVDNNKQKFVPATVLQATRRDQSNKSSFQSFPSIQTKTEAEEISGQNDVSSSMTLLPAQRIVQLCAQPVSIDTLMEVTELSFAELNELLFELQISGKITQTFAGLWYKK